MECAAYHAVDPTHKVIQLTTTEEGQPIGGIIGTYVQQMRAGAC